MSRTDQIIYSHYFKTIGNENKEKNIKSEGVSKCFFHFPPRGSLDHGILP